MRFNLYSNLKGQNEKKKKTKTKIKYTKMRPRIEDSIGGKCSKSIFIK